MMVITIVLLINLTFDLFLKVTVLCEEADRLESSHPDSTLDIQSKKDEIANNWENLRSKVSNICNLIFKITFSYSAKWQEVLLIGVEKGGPPTHHSQ